MRLALCDALCDPLPLEQPCSLSLCHCFAAPATPLPLCSAQAYDKRMQLKDRLGEQMALEVRAALDHASQLEAGAVGAVEAQLVRRGHQLAELETALQRGRELQEAKQRLAAAEAQRKAEAHATQEAAAAIELARQREAGEAEMSRIVATEHTCVGALERAAATEHAQLERALRTASDVQEQLERELEEARLQAQLGDAHMHAAVLDEIDTRVREARSEAREEAQGLVAEVGLKCQQKVSLHAPHDCGVARRQPRGCARAAPPHPRPGCVVAVPR